MLHPGQPAARTRRRTRPLARSRAPMLVACLIASLPWMSGGAAPRPDSSWIEMIRDDDEGMEVVLRAPPLVRDGRTVQVPGFAWGGEPGLPIEFERAALIAVPGSRGAVLEIASQETETQSGVEAPRVPWGKEARDSAPTAGVAAPQSWTTQVPTAAVRLENGGMVRGRDVTTLRFTPLLFDPKGGATYVHTVRLRLRFADRPAPREAATADEPLHAAFLNTTTAARWRTRFEVQKPTALASTLLPQRRIRLRIPRTGLYALNHARLQAILGAELDSIDPTQLQIFMDTWAPIPLRADSLPASWQTDYALRETAIWVQGEADHSFDTQDSIVFYALGPEDYVDLTGLRADSLLHAQNPYDRFQVAWLVWGEANGLRLASVPSSAPGTPPDLVQSTWARLHFEEDLQFDEVDDLWMWDELRTNNPVFVAFDADLGRVTNPAALLRIGISDGDPYSRPDHAVNVRLNNEDLGVIRWIKPTSRPQNHYATFPVTLLTSSRLELSLSRTLPSEPTAFLKFDLSWDRPLVLPTRGSEAGRLRWSRRPTTPDEAYELVGFGTQEPWVLDVSDALRPVRLTDATAPGTPGTWRLRYGRGQGIRTHFLAVNAPTLMDPANVNQETLRPLQRPASVPDMVIVTEASLLSQAQRLAQHRAAHFPGAATLGHVPDVQVVDIADIYDNFSGGRVDALAIRNYLKLLYTQPLLPGETSPRLRYVLLFGEATHDPRRLDPGSTATLVPTVHAWYANPMDAGVGGVQRPPQHLRRWFAVEDWLGEMDAPRAAGLSNMHPLPDLGVGRLTPRTLGDAERLVDKLIAYDTSTDYGAWRTRVVLSADDECKPGQGCFESEHVEGMESLVPWTPPEWDIDKSYLTEYPAVLGQKPQGRAAFIRSWSEGCALVCYQGHGAPRQLADEVLFLSTDIPSLTNSRRLPVFMAYSCTVAEFDAPELQTMAEDLIASTAGGAIAAMGATVETFASPNADYNVEVWQAMFEFGATSKVPFGIIHQLAKNRSSLFDGLNNEKYVLLGDPAMTLLAPEALVAFSGDADSLQAGRSTRVEGTVHLGGESTALAGFDGFADVEVSGTADDSGYQSATSTLRIPYDLPGPPLYRGRVAVEDGRLQFQFVVPLGAKLGNKARISAYAWETSSARDAKGADNSVRVVRAAVPDSSLGPPRIALYFPNNLTKVKPGTPLVGEIRDENGINIQGTTLPSSILLDFDSRNQPLNVTAQFRYADGSDSVGAVTVPLPDGLEPGRHQATMIASDNLQNRSTQSLDFDVVPASATLMANVIAFPNPFRDRTYFFFELTDPADVVVRVFTASGREVWRTQQFVDEPQQVSILWEGIDFARDALANGTYLYRVEAHPRQTTGQAGPVLKHVGKVVIMRP